MWSQTFTISGAELIDITGDGLLNAVVLVGSSANNMQPGDFVELTITYAPEPSTALLMGMGLVAMGATRRRSPWAARPLARVAAIACRPCDVLGPVLTRCSLLTHCSRGATKVRTSRCSDRIKWC